MCISMLICNTGIIMLICIICFIIPDYKSFVVIQINVHSVFKADLGNYSLKANILLILVAFVDSS